MTNIDEMIDEIYSAFSKAPRPDICDITSHRCHECNRIRVDFADFNNRQVPDSVIKYHSDALPLFSASALRYYLPRYMEYSLLNEGSNAAESVFFELCPSPINDWHLQRIESFTNTEKELVTRYLQAHASIYLDDMEDINKCLYLWA